MNKTYYHGTSIDIEEVDLNHSRIDIDFGPGFYLCEDEKIAALWAARKKDSYVIKYEADFDSLRVHAFADDYEWLKFVADNIGCLDDSSLGDYDVIIGRSAEDNPTTKIEEYINGELTADEAIELLKITQHSDQIVVKTEKAKECLKKVDVIHLSEQEKEEYREKYKKEQKEIREKVRRFKEELQVKKCEIPDKIISSLNCENVQ